MIPYFEYIILNQTINLGSHEFTNRDILSFTAIYSSETPHHGILDTSNEKCDRLRAGNWHGCCVWMRLMIIHRQKLIDICSKKNMPIPRLGPSPGFLNLRWTKPIYQGDTIFYSTTPCEKRDLKSRPQWGLLRSLNEGTNQAGELVLSFIGQQFWERLEPSE